MFKKLILTGLLCLGLFVVSEFKAHAAVLKYCFYCRSDVPVLEGFKGGSNKVIQEDGKIVQFDVTAPQGVTPIAVCMNPVNFLIAPGQAATRKFVTTDTPFDENNCNQKEKGLCTVDGFVPTETHDFAQPYSQDLLPLITDPNGNFIQGCDPIQGASQQSCFESFWGVADACNNLWTPIAVLFPQLVLDAKVFDFDTLKESFQAVCSYPLSELQETNGILDPVDASCIQQQTGKKNR